MVAPTGAPEHAVVPSVVDGVDGGVARPDAGPDAMGVPEQVEELLVAAVLHGPQRAGGNRALGLVLLEGGGVLRSRHREGQILRAREEVELPVVPRLEDPVARLHRPGLRPVSSSVTHR